MPISIAIYQANGSRSPRYQFPEEEADKEARRKMGSNRGNSIAKSYANSARGSLFAGDILSRKYRLCPSHRRRVQPPGANVVDRVGAVHHGDSLKDIPDDRLSGRANNGGDTRARGRQRGVRIGEGKGREKDPAARHPRGMHNQDSTGPKRERAHTCSSAACFVSCPDDFKLRRYRRAISATAAVVPAGPG